MYPQLLETSSAHREKCLKVTPQPQQSAKVREPRPFAAQSRFLWSLEATLLKSYAHLMLPIDSFMKSHHQPPFAHLGIPGPPRSWQEWTPWTWNVASMQLWSWSWRPVNRPWRTSGSKLSCHVMSCHFCRSNCLRVSSFGGIGEDLQAHLQPLRDSTGRDYLWVQNAMLFLTCLHWFGGWCSMQIHVIFIASYE